MGEFQKGEQGIRVEAVVGEAPLDPEPIGDGDGGAEAQRREGGDGPGRGQEQDVEQQEGGRGEVEGQVGGQGELEVWRHDQGRVDGAQAPVQQRDEDFERGRCHGQHVLGHEQAPRQGHVCHHSQDERRRRQRQSNDGQVLKVPSVRLVDRVRVLHQPYVAVGKRRQAQDVHHWRQAA